MKHALLIFVAVCLLQGCSSQPTRPKYPDPYWDGIWGKNIKYMISTPGVDKKGADTIWFARDSRKMALHTLWSVDTTEYDYRNFIVHVLSSGESPDNRIYKYQQTGDTIFSASYSIKHQYWNYSLNDLDSSMNSTGRFVVDQKGRVASEINEMEFIVFDYGEDNLLDTEVRFSKDSTKISSSHYSYDRDQLLSISHFDNNDVLLFTHHMKSGLPDSVVFPDRVVKYYYVYYK